MHSNTLSLFLAVVSGLTLSEASVLPRHPPPPPAAGPPGLGPHGPRDPPPPPPPG
ncbi:lipase 1, partial [Fusarium flagelliforme]